MRFGAHSPKKYASPKGANAFPVLLDMDGTLLDLAFDNHFWLSHIIEHHAQLNDQTTEDSLASLQPKFNAAKGTLAWYCTDYWSEQLGFSIAEQKRQQAHRIALRKDSLAFLQWLDQHNIPCWLVTNAHPDTIEIKLAQTHIGSYFEAIYCSHELGFAKEQPEFWHKLQAMQAFDPSTSVFVDDTLSVLGAAKDYGVERLFHIDQPDSTQPPVESSAFEQIRFLDELEKPISQWLAPLARSAQSTPEES